MRTLYNPSEYYKRVLDHLDRVENPLPEPRQGDLRSGIAKLARVIVALGIRDTERHEFWRFMCRILAYHRGRFKEALTLAAAGYHFRKITEIYCVETSELPDKL
jgi:hypothetical protein